MQTEPLLTTPTDTISSAAPGETGTEPEFARVLDRTAQAWGRRAGAAAKPPIGSVLNADPGQSLREDALPVRDPRMDERRPIDAESPGTNPLATPPANPAAQADSPRADRINDVSRDQPDGAHDTSGRSGTTPNGPGTPGTTSAASTSQPALPTTDTQPSQPGAAPTTRTTNTAAAISAASQPGVLAPSTPAAGVVAAKSEPGGVSSIAGVAGAGARGGRQLLARLERAAPPLALERDAEAVGQVTRGLAAALRQGGGRATLRLTPDHLGQVTIELRVQGTDVAAKIDAATDPARRLLEASTDELRAALEARGLRVERIDIEGPRHQDGPQAAQDALDSSRTFADARHGRRDRPDAERRNPGIAGHAEISATDGGGERAWAGVTRGLGGEILRLDALA